MKLIRYDWDMEGTGFAMSIWLYECELDAHGLRVG